MVDKNQPSSPQDFILGLIEELTGQRSMLIIPRIFIQVTGSINSAMLLSQIIYWSDKSTIRGMKRRLVFAKTSEEFEQELGLGHRAFDNARQKLASLGLITTKIGGFSGKKCIFWHPELEKISLSIQQAIDVSQSKEETLDADYEDFLDDMLDTKDRTIYTNRTNGLSPDVQNESPQPGTRKVAKGLDDSMLFGQEMTVETCLSNTNITSENTQKTTTNNLQTNNEVVGGSSVISDSFKKSIQTATYKEESASYILSINKELNEKEARNLIEKLGSALIDRDGITKEQFQMMLTFSAVTGYSDYLRIDIKDNNQRTIKERWIDPTELWITKEITVESIRVAMQDAIKDGMHKKLICPVSYSPRILEAGKKQSSRTNHLDDEF